MIVSICLANLALACLIGFVIYVALKNSRSTAEAQLMRAEFEIMAKRVFEAETQRFRQTSEAGIERVLEPIQQRLRDFEKKVDDVYQSEGRERHVLKSEVEKLIALNEKITNETHLLTQALKGDSKFQGDWGEMILETILEGAGLREGVEFSTQESFQDSEGKRFRPDVVVRLPDNKQIIIDSKVSLKAYEAYCRAETDVLRETLLKAHVASIDRHIDELGAKDYAKLQGLRAPEFVFLFTPIEAAYVLAMRADPEISTRAWQRGVAVVTSTTLFTSLKTVASLWRLEKQNRNAQEIAEEAAKLYDKFVGFYEDFERVGRVFDQGAQQFADAKRKLRDGPGNVFKKIENLRELGAAPSKRIRSDLLGEP